MKKAIKIIAIILMICILLAAIGFAATAYLTFSGVGNPITKYKATKAIEEYVAQNYPQNDFTDIHVTYNFKFDVYGSQIVSQSSADTRFYVSYNDGVIEDTYDEYVIGGLNTYARIIDELDDEITNLITDRYGAQVELCLFDLHSTRSTTDSSKKVINVVNLDESLDIKSIQELGFEPSLTVWLKTEKINYSNAASKFIEIKELMDSNGIYISEYSVSLRLPESYEDRQSKKINVHNFPYELIGSDEFMDKIIEYDKLGKETGK